MLFNWLLAKLAKCQVSTIFMGLLGVIIIILIGKSLSNSQPQGLS